MRCLLPTAALLIVSLAASAPSAQTLRPSELARQVAPESARAAVGSVWAPQRFTGASTFYGQLNFIGGSDPDGPGAITMTAPDFPTTSFEAEPEDLLPVAGYVQPGDETTQFFVNNPDQFVSYVTGSGAYTTLGTITGFNFPGQEGIVGMQVQPQTGQVKVFTLGCEFDAATDDYFQSFMYDFDPATLTLSNSFELRDPNATGEPGDEGICGISFSWDGADEIYGVDLFKDKVVSINGATGELIAFLDDPSDEGLIEDINFIQTAAWDEATDTHYFFILSRTDPQPQNNVQGFVFAIDADGVYAYIGMIDGNEPPNEVLSGSFPYNNVMVTAEGAATQSNIAVGAISPNPSAASARVPFVLPSAMDVRLTVLDVLGREVAVLADGAFAAGAHAERLDVRALAPGTYVVRLTAGGEVATRTLSVAR